MSSMPYSYLFEETRDTRLAGDRRDIEYLKRRFPESTGGGLGNGIYAIEVFENLTPLAAGDGAFEWEIPEDLDGAVLLKAEAYITTASSSGSVQVQIRNETTGHDMLSTKLTIDVGDLNSKDSAIPAVVDATYEAVSWGDHLNIDVDAIGTGATGLGVILFFTPLATKTIAVQGAKGDPGGVTDWTGAWNSGTTYTTSQAVSNGGTSYVAIQGSTGVEPGVTPGWESYWMVLTERSGTGALTLIDNNQGRIIDAGFKGIVEVPFPATIVACNVFADAVCSLEWDIWKTTYASYPPTSADSIVGASPPVLSAANRSTDTALTGWTVAIAKGDILYFTIVANDYARWVCLSLEYERS